MKTLIRIFTVLFLFSTTLYGQTADQPPPIPSDEEPEVLTRGPVNEAFAQPVNIDEEEENGFTAPQAPPPDIEETPPPDRPEGDQFAWVPGYWAWDSDISEYIWVSGCWRAVPPGKYWVPGYWAEMPDGWRWVAGFWVPVSTREIEYLPAPPLVYNVEPPVTGSPDRIWVPPCWYWSHGRYTLRAGYWIDAREDWVWVPSHYVWTPRGYVFVGGHWDYPLHHRGVLFAPVHFHRRVHGRARLSYSLSVVVNIGNLEFGLFTRPRYGHYYFGDYYDSVYIGIGIFPWYECESHHTWYDPIYYHNRWRHRRDIPHWKQHERREYERRRADKKLRPPRTYRELERRVRSMPDSGRKHFEIAEPMKRMLIKKDTSFRFRQDKPKERKQISKHVEEVHRYVRERSRRESQNDRKADSGKSGRVSNKPRESDPKPGYKKTEKQEPDRKDNSYPGHVRTKDGSKGDRKSGVYPDRRERKANSPAEYEVKNYRPDNVKVRNSPVVNKKKKRTVNKKSPSPPDEETKKTGKREDRKDDRNRR